MEEHSRRSVGEGYTKYHCVSLFMNVDRRVGVCDSARKEGCREGGLEEFGFVD
jgi:hypothetical protein